MLLAVDVGNSNILFGVWDGNRWMDQHRMETHPIQKGSTFAKLLKEWSDYPIDVAIISSVVPDVVRPLVAFIQDVWSVEPQLLNSETDTGITLGADKPERVGADLIADAVGGYALVHDNCVVVDFGTATTVMTVDVPGTLSGVAICTGLKVSVDALVGKTAQLPDIPLEIPAQTLGRNTVEAMQSGLVLGHLCMVEGLIDRIRRDQDVAAVVATGGLVSLFAPHTTYFDHVAPMLTLDGLRIVMDRQ